MIMDTAKSYIRSFPVQGANGFGALLVGITLCVIVKTLSARLRSHYPPLPPGPRPLPIIGNLLDFPRGSSEPEGPHLGRHKALFGPISSLSAFGRTFIIVNDQTAAFELLDKRSLISSDRPVAPFGGQMVGFDRWLTSFKHYDNELKTHRKLMHNLIGTHAAMERFEELEEIETHRFLFKVLNAPDNLLDHIRALPGALILKLSYGYSTGQEEYDPLVLLAFEVTADIFAKSFQHGQWIVDFLPFVRNFPEWLPGMEFKRKAREWAKKTAAFCDKPYAFVQHQMATGKATSSFTSGCISTGVSEDVGETIVKSVAASLFAGGSDTTFATLTTFYLAMVENPNVLKRAQEEVDRVVGSERLPTFSDRKNLPYVEAVLKETFRWETVVTTTPHLTTEEDTYMGYRIPKGAVILPNLWQMAHDPENYHDPFAFKPERFMGENGMPVEQDPHAFVFGFGRRICPGKELADSSLFIAIASSLAVFNIRKARDEKGREIEPVHEYTLGALSHAKPFKCLVTPRSDKATKLIQCVEDEHPFEAGDSDTLKAL